MGDRYEMTSGNGSRSPEGSGTFKLPREQDLDRDRTASMADEGGVSGAVADLREQLDPYQPAYDIELAMPRLRWFDRVPWSTFMWSAVAIGAAGLLTGLALRVRTRRA